MIRLSELILFVICIFLNQYLLQATIYSCNTTSSCGCSKNEVIINSRIVGGEPAASHSWVWAVSLRIPPNKHFCGGTILSSNHVLTAAHCVESSYFSRVELTAVLGTDNLNDNNGQKLVVSKIHIHPRWNSYTKENDIAILELKTAISFKDDNVGKLCLPVLHDIVETDFPLTNSKLVAIGWGYTRQGGVESSILRQVTVEAVGNNEIKCSNSINNNRLQFCAAINGGGKDTCQGDSGGPLMYYSEIYKQWILAGITSYGRGCGLSNYAGIYTRVSMYVDWINSTIDKDDMTISRGNTVNVRAMSNIYCIIVLSCLFIIRSF